VDQSIVDAKFRVHIKKSIEEETELENVSKDLTDLAIEAGQMG
jgi:hypothetical protein